MLEMEILNTPGLPYAYRVFGKGEAELIIEMGLGTSAGEWRHIAEKLSEKYTVLLYERSREIKPERTPENIARELRALLQRLGCEKKTMIVAHSQGGLYAQQFARLYPEMTKGLVLLDPLSASDSEYKKILTPDEQKKSGFDKSANLAAMQKLAKLHLGFIIKGVMRKAPPFYYYNGFSAEDTDYILESVTKSEVYASALEEYRLAHEEALVRPLREKEGFPKIPLFLVTHTREFMIKEIEEFGHADRQCAEKAEDLWQSLMKRYLELSAVSEYRQAENSGHSIHLTEPELIDEALEWINGRA